MVRKAVNTDIETLMPIFEAAKKALGSRGIDQWQDGYPDRDAIARDIKKQDGYVVDRDGKIMAYAAVSFDGEPTYEVIEDGQWLTENGYRHEDGADHFTDAGYAVIHRIVSAPDIKRCGAATRLLGHAEALCRKRGVRSIRIDTHSDNVIMQQWLQKNNFTYCGRITLIDGSPRIAYEKIL